MKHPLPSLLKVCVSLLVLCTTAQATAQAGWPDLKTVKAQTGGGEKDAALIVGIEDYLLVPDVSGAVDNAVGWYNWLTKGRAVPLENVVLLKNHEATREKVLKQARAVAGKVGRGGTLWLIFIGHGAPGIKGIEGVLVGADAQQEAESLYARSVSQSELLGNFAKGPQARTIALFDTCFSGRLESGDAIVEGLQPLVPVRSAKKKNKLLLFTAGSPDQFAGPLPGVRRPAFSYLMLGALRGWADADDDLSVTAQEAIDYTRVALTILLKDRQQTPSLSAGSQDVVLASKATERGPDLTQIVLGERKERKIIPRKTPRGLGRVFLEAKDGGQYTLVVKTSDGGVRKCFKTVEKGTPCVLSGLPQGPTTVMVTGSIEYSKKIDLGHEAVDIGANGASDWTGWTALGLVAVSLSSVALTGGTTTVNGVEAKRTTAQEVGDGVLFVSFLGSLVFGAIWAFDKDKVDLKREPLVETADAAPFELKLALGAGGGGLFLNMSW